jgi:thiol-disulfide isomerase/thioredoxin
VYVPCAGPILAGVTTASAAQDFTAGKLVVALAYAAGSGVVIYALILGGRKLVDRLKPIQSKIQVGLGAVMVAVALAMLADLDLRFQQSIAENLPAFLRNPAAPLEESGLVSDEIDQVSGRSPHSATSEGGGIEAEMGLKLPVLGAAPEIVPGGEWFNTEPFTLAEQSEEGRVTLIDFWTYTCINCIRTLPYLRAWHEEYADEGLTILGVHTPEFAFERDPGNVETAIGEYDIEYPVVQDNEYGTWDAFGNRYWPAKYLIDADGDVRYVHFGEGEYENTERAIRSLLEEAGSRNLGPEAEASAETADPATITPETYFGSLRAQGFVNGPILPGTRDYGDWDADKLGLNQFAYSGTWKVTGEHASAEENASIGMRFQARRVFCVMGAPDSGEVRVLLDGEPIPDDLAGEDVDEGAATVSGQRLYRLVELPEAGVHTLTLEFDPGVSGYAFTFG